MLACGVAFSVLPRDFAACRVVLLHGVFVYVHVYAAIARILGGCEHFFVALWQRSSEVF